MFDIKSWVARYEDALRLWMIVLLLVFTIVSSWTITLLIRAQDDACHALQTTQQTLVNVVNKAYTPLRPDLLTKQQLDDIEKQKDDILDLIEYPPSCDL